MKQYKVYTLTDPRNGKIRYCGYTKRPLIKRLWGHTSTANSHEKNNTNGNVLLHRWVNKLKKLGLKPIIELLEDYDSMNDAYEGEKYWIYQLRSWGFDLLNVKEGGRYCKHYKEKRTEEEYNYKTKPVYKYSKRGKFICEYKSVKAASEDVGVTLGAITMASTNKEYTPLSGGFYWRDYKQDKIKVKKRIGGMYGKKHTEEYKKWASESRKGKKVPKDILAKRVKSQMKPIIQYDTNMNKIKTWSSQKEVREKLGLKLYSDRFGENHIQHGYKWEFA